MTSRRQHKSPHSSIKIIQPGTPTNITGNFPAGIRISRRPPPGQLGTLPLLPIIQGSNKALPLPASAFNAFGPASPGLHPVFAKKKRTVFKGPTIGGVTTGSSSRAGRTTSGNTSVSRTSSLQGRETGGTAIAEEDEDEENEDEFVVGEMPDPFDTMGGTVLEEQDELVEEVEAFGPLAENEKVVEEDEREESGCSTNFVDGVHL